MWTPTHILVTVCKARNLLEKGKGGNDAYCMIGMGKEKFLTSVRQKTLSPVWDEQAEFMLSERADLKITVYHKSSIIDEFVGRVVISVADLFNENNKSFVKWYKLQSKEENSKKAAKERGEIEIRVEFITKPKTGSVMDLSSLSKTNKEKTLSLKNLKDKSHNFRHSFKENFKLLNKSKSKSKINEDNQLGEQAKRMNGSKMDFLDGEDMNSLCSSYSSLNGNRLSSDKQINRYNHSRASFMSGASSRNDVDSMDNSTNNDEELIDELDESSLSFNRNSSFRRSSLRRPSKKSNKITLESESVDYNKTNNVGVIPFSNEQQRYNVLDSVIHEENSSPYLTAPNSGTKPEEPSFANIFTSSFSSGTEKNEFDSVRIEPLIIQQEEKPEPKAHDVPAIYLSPNLTESVTNSSAVTITKSEPDTSNETNKSKKNSDDEDDDDHIDWASSDEEEIVKEVETFERNQNLKILDNLVQKQETELGTQTNKNTKINQELDNNILPTSTFSIDIDPFSPLSSSLSLSFTNSNKLDPFFDSPQSVQLFDPFSDTNMSKQNQEKSFSDAVAENQADFENNFEPVMEPIEEQYEQNKESQESNDTDSVVEIKSQMSESSDSYSIQRKDKEQTENKEETDDEKNFDDDMDSAFKTFTQSESQSKIAEDMPDMANDLAEAGRQFEELVEQEENEEFYEPNEVQLVESNLVKSELVSEDTEAGELSRNRITRQSERRRVVPGQDLTSDLNLNIERGSNTNDSFVSYSNVTKSNRSSMKFDFNENKTSNASNDEIKTPDFDQNYIFQDDHNMKPEEELSINVNGRGLPDLINQKESSDKAKKYLEGLDGVKLDEITVPDSLKKQLEYFDRDELLQLIAYQKRHLDLKESRIKDLEIYIDNLVVKIMETDPVILMNETYSPMKNKLYA